MPSHLRSVLPSILPIVPTLKPGPFNHPAWLFEPKYDGFRGLFYLTRSVGTLYSKRGNLMTRFAGLARQIASELGARELILDGEIVSLDNEGRIDFWGLMRGQGTWPTRRSTCFGWMDRISAPGRSGSGSVGWKS